MNEKNSKTPTHDSGLFLGLMSGTSLDGVDAVLARFEPSLEIRFARTYELPDNLVKKSAAALANGRGNPS